MICPANAFMMAGLKREGAIRLAGLIILFNRNSLDKNMEQDYT